MFFKRSYRGSLKDLYALIKGGIVASNTMTALGAMALSPWPASMSLVEIGIRALELCAGTACLVAGSCAVNNWLDRDIDALMARTKDRPTVSGRIGSTATLAIGGGLLLLGMTFLALDGRGPAMLGAFGAFVYIIPYTLWSKRRSGISSFVGGVAGAIPPLMGWAVLDPRLGGPALFLFAFLVAWQQAHVRALALRRRVDFDRAEVPMPGLAKPGLSSHASGDTASQSPNLRRFPGLSPDQAARWAVLAWIAVLLPFPLLVAKKLDSHFAIAFSIFETGLIVLWGLIGVLAARKARYAKTVAWGSLMFFLSLGQLVIFFSGLLIAKLLGLAL
ncbi:MAG TPA: protoheme IX farnesyltransferase [Rectinemataceae bacterium]|nr:protoheme IX farnesyltransferase [Rectinemataceae bacterium]